MLAQYTLKSMMSLFSAMSKTIHFAATGSILNISNVNNIAPNLPYKFNSTFSIQYPRI